MSNPIHILILEDLQADFDLAQREIRRSVDDCVFQQAETQEDFLNILGSFKPDVVLSDYSLPHFDGMKALELTLKHAPLTSFIIWTGSLSEDTAVKCMKAGATNYVIKENIKRLGPAVVHALEERRLKLERKQVEDTLRQSEVRFRSLIENSMDNISILSEDGTLLWENPAVNRTLGYKQDEHVGQNLFELMHPDDIVWVQGRLANVLKTPGVSEDGVFRLRHQNGAWIWLEAIATNLLNEPSVNGIVVNYRDITERRNAEIALQQRNDDLALINVVNDAVIKGENLGVVMRMLANEVKRIFDGGGCGLYLLDGNGQSITLQQTLLKPEINKKIEQLIGSTIPLVKFPVQQGGLFDRVLQSGRGIIIDTPELVQGFMAEFTETAFLNTPTRVVIHKLLPKIYKALNIQSVILIPLIAGERTMGFLDVSSSSLYTAGDLERIENIGRQLTAAIQHQQANDRMQQSEKFLQSVQDALSANIAILDAAGTIVRVNLAWRKFAEQNGLIHDTYGVGLNYLDICDSATGPYAEEAPEVAKTIRDILAGRKKQAQIEYPCHSPEERRWFTLKITSFVEEDQRWVVLAHENITDRKQAEEAIKETSEQFRTLFDASPEAIMLLDPHGDWSILDCNEQACSMNGYTRDELIGQSVNIFNLTPGDPDERTDYINRVRQAGILRYETLHRHKEGNIFPVEVSTSLITLGGREVVLGIDRDITERKEAEKNLLASEEMLRTRDELLKESQRIARLGHYDLNISTGIWESSDTLDDVLGIDEKYFRDLDGWADIVHPAQRDEMLMYLTKDVFDGHINFDREYRIVRKSDQREIWVHGLGRLIYDKDDHPVRMIGTIQDITERKHADKALRESEERYRQLFNAAPIGVAVHINGKLVFANEAAARIVGANSPEILIGMSVMDFVHKDDRKYTLEALQHMLRGEAGWYPREERFLRLDGSVINVEVTATTLAYMGRQAVQVIVQDITGRKQAEEETQRHLAEMQALYENGLAVGQLLELHEIGERIIETFSNYLSWHHVTIRLAKEGSDELELVAFSLPHMPNHEAEDVRQNFAKRISRTGQGMSGWVVQTGTPIRAGNVYEYPQYVDVYGGIQSGLYMPLMIGGYAIGVISVESEEPDAFSLEDERLLATLASQAAVAFENARLYQSSRQELLERKRAEDALRVSETHYRELADSITDIFFELDHDLRYSHWNKASETLTGVSAKDAIGKTMREILGDSDEQARVGKIYETILESQQPCTFETLFTLNKELRSFEITAYPSTRGVSVVAKDVTERKRAEVILQKRFELMEFSAHHSLNELMQKITDEVSELTSSEIAFFHFVEPDQNTLSTQTWSTNTLKLSHVPDSAGTHLSLDQAGVWAEAARQRRSIVQNDYESIPKRKELPEGHVRMVREMVIPIIRNEKIMAVVGIANKVQEYTQQDLDTAERLADYAWDITERKRMETVLADERNQLARRVEERTSELIKANSNLARALRVKDEFLANMSHELRTPLNAILGLSESLGEQIAGPLNEKQLKYITTIGESGHHLLSLINDILDLAKIEAGQITLDINKVDVNGVCQASMRMVKQLAQKKNQEILFSVDENISLMWADERRLKQMLVNLLSNAVKFTPEYGKIGLDVRGHQDENRVEFSIWDNGIGIAENDTALLFQPFVQLDSGLARESTGTGLGLALVSQMARLHGGSVSVTSEPDKGSRFTIILPWEPALIRETAEKLKTTGKLWLKAANYKKKILLIEDTVEVVMMIRDYLETAGYDVITAQDGIDGIYQAKIVQPDLILMDIQMPRMDGIEATKKLRENPKFKHVPIVALTALAMPNDRERCIAAGMNEYISKPINLKALVKIIQKNLSMGEEKTRPV